MCNDDVPRQVTIAPLKGAETQFAQFVEGLIDAGVQIGGGQYPYPAREQCAIIVQPKGNLECELRIPLDSETNGGFVAQKGAAPVKLGAKFKMLKPTTGAQEISSVVTLDHNTTSTHSPVGPSRRRSVFGGQT